MATEVYKFQKILLSFSYHNFELVLEKICSENVNPECFLSVEC